MLNLKNTIMKKMILTTAMIAFTAMLFSQEEVKRNNSIGMNISSLVNTTFKLNYEHSFNNMTSVVINGGIILYEDQNKQYNGACGELQYRFSAPFNNLFPKGLAYFAPYAGFQYVDYTNSNTISHYDYSTSSYITTTTNISNQYSNITGGCLFGVRTNLSSRFFVDVNVGGGFRYELLNKDRTLIDLGTQSLGYSGIYPRGNIVLGINF
jgi:hypothetical protein